MKNLLLFSTLLLTSTGIFAQLTVKPTLSGADSYVFVNDQVLFVKNEINLTRNDLSTNTEANIYLRGDAQLIQENDSALNSCSGQVSVQQNSPVTNAWAYYYWCSPIGSPGPTANPRLPGNQYFGVSQIFEAQPTLGPTNAIRATTTTGHNGSEGPLTISTRWLYTHLEPGTEAEADYQRMNGGNNAPPGFGFTMKGVGSTTPGDTQLYEFRGRPNNGDFIITVGNDLMTLSGNPYPSALDLNKLFWEPGNAELQVFWYYDEDRTVPTHYYSNKPYGYGIFTVGDEDTDGNPYNGSHPGIYAPAQFYIWNAGGTNGGTQTGGPPLNDGNKRFAPIGQGIMFVGDAEGEVTIKNSHRVFFKEDTTGSVFQRPGGEDSFSETSTPANPAHSTIAETAREDFRTPQLRFRTIFDDAMTREMVLAFYDQATDGYDRGLDGLSPQDLQTDAYFPIGPDNNRKPFVINGIKFDRNKQVPIAFKIKNTTQIRLQVVEEIKRPYRQAYLFDRQENTYLPLASANPGGSRFTLPAGTYDNRFFIVFKNPSIDKHRPIEEERLVVLESVSFFQNNPGQRLEVSNPEGYTFKSASVFDMSGKRVIGEQNLGDNSKYSFYTGNLSDGVYLVKLTTSEDITIDYKAIVRN